MVEVGFHLVSYSEHCPFVAPPLLLLPLFLLFFFFLTDTITNVRREGEKEDGFEI